MAEEYKGADLTTVYDDDFTKKPFDLNVSGEQAPKYMTGADFIKLATINQKWKDPQFVIPSGRSDVMGRDITKVEEFGQSFITSASDAVANIPDNIMNEAGQIVLEAYGDKNKLAKRLTRYLSGVLPKLPGIKVQPGELAGEIIEKAKPFKPYDDDVIDALDGREYPVVEWAKKTIANTTKAVQERELANALTAERRGIDQGAFTNKFATIVGAMAPIIGAGYATGGIASALGAAPATASAIASGTMKAATLADMTGQYAYETASKYLERTGDTDFSEFTPEDAQGLSALGYGAIGTAIEFGFGGVEPLFAQAFTKTGIENGIMKAVGKVTVGEAWEEFLQEWEEFLFRQADGTNDRTWGEVLKDSVKAALWGGLVGGATGGVVYRTQRRNIANILAKTGLDFKDGLKVADQVLNDTQGEIQKNFDAAMSKGAEAPDTVRNKIRQNISMMYENVDIPEAEKQDIIDAQTNLEVGLLMSESAERGFVPEESPLLQGVVNEIGYFREGIPQNLKTQVESLNTEIAGLREQLRVEQEKEAKDFAKIDQLETKITRFFEKLPQDIASLVEIDRQKAREMLAEQSRLLSEKQSRRKVVAEVRSKALRAMNKQDESELQKSLRRLQEETKSEEKKTRETERKVWQEQRKTRKAINKLRQKIFVDRARIQGIYDLDSDIAIDLLHKAGYTNKQIAEMEPRDLEQALWNTSVKPTKAEKEFVKSKAQNVIEELKKQGIDARAKNDVSGDASVYIVVGNDVFRIGLTRTGKKHEQAYTANINANAPIQEIIELIKQNRGKPKTRGHELLGVESNILSQNKNRGFYIPELRFIGRTEKMDASTLSHELAHDWIQQFFRWYRSGKASDSFMKSWGAVEKALGIPADALNVPENASEAFARAYEGWIQNKTDWEKDIAVDDTNRDELIKTMERYREYLTDIYGDLTNPYFREAWGEVGELKPEIKAWFEMATLGGDTIESQVKTGAITPEEATIQKTAQNIDKVAEKSVDALSAQEKQEIDAVERINDTKRYEVKGGNKNALQNRLSSMAQDMDANNVALGRYDTHRDMLEVARQADEFVRTRRDEALDIINGIRAETEGLYASDL